MYIYPDNLKSKAVMWMWELKDIGIIATGAIISVISLTQIKFIVPLAVTAAYAFLTIRFEDTSIMMFIQNAWRFFIRKKQMYEWRFTNEEEQER